MRSGNARQIVGLSVLLTLVAGIGSAFGQQTSDGRPLEYIESSSPLPGGGTVTSIQYPGQQSWSLEQVRETAGRESSGVAVPGGERSVLVQSPAPGAVPSPAGQSVLAPNVQYAAAPPAAAVQPIAAAPAWGGTPQVPSLGVPTAWNRSLSPGCNSCGTPAAGYTASGVYAPVNLSGLQPPAASVPPTLPVQTQTALLPARSDGTAAAVQLENLPPGSWVGRGIVGSPKLYVDGQPVRNFFRFVIP